MLPGNARYFEFRWGLTAGPFPKEQGDKEGWIIG